MVTKILEQNMHKFLDVMPFSLKKSSLYELDLSSENTELYGNEIVENEQINKFITQKLQSTNSIAAIGGYAEDRLIYKQSQHFGGASENSRTIHLGVDIWHKAGTSIFAPYKAEIHSFKNNDNFGDYGPTIILMHKIENVEFFTLYGHLSKKSLEKLKVGKKISTGEKIAELGSPNENGGWFPHLHFQLITDIQNYLGDFPGVCSKPDKEKFLKLCPNPKHLLKIDFL